MLNIRQTEEKSYEQYMEEALKKISLYNSEWTNLNPSDPGITILENTTALNVLQENFFTELNNEAKRALLNLTGFKQKKGEKATVYIASENVTESFILPENQQFRVGELVFECEKATLVSSGRIIEFIAGNKKCNEVLKKGNRFPAKVFTDKPEKSMETYILFNDLPIEENKVSIYIEIQHQYDRNPSDENVNLAAIRWQCYTNDGFKDIECEDETQCFLYDGIMNFNFENIKPAIYNYESQKCYAIRGILERTEYDTPPQILSISGPLFRLSEQQTKAIAREYIDASEISIYSDILENDYTRIYKWDDAEKCYVLFESENYLLNHEEFGMFNYQFEKTHSKILISAYSEEMMQMCKLGYIEGYDDEEIDIPNSGKIIAKFSIILEIKNDNKNVKYFYMLPDIINEGGFKYSVNAETGKIHIADCGNFCGCTVYIGELVISNGEAGNIPQGKQFIPSGYDSGTVFYNPLRGRGGRDYETIEQLEKRYIIDVNSNYTAVTAEDYNRIVKNTPGLCIDKVNTYIKDEDTMVHIAVKPYSNKERPGLSKTYKRIITDNLEDKRLLNTVIKLESPVYSSVNVYGRINVKEHYIDAENIIINRISESINYLKKKKAFGKKLRFDEVFADIESLECVENINDLNIKPSNLTYIKMDGVDIIPNGNCILYPGEIKIDIHMMH